MLNEKAVPNAFESYCFTFKLKYLNAKCLLTSHKDYVTGKEKDGLLPANT